MNYSKLVDIYSCFITAAVLIFSVILGLEFNPILVVFVVVPLVMLFLNPLHKTLKRLFRL